MPAQPARARPAAGPTDALLAALDGADNEATRPMPAGTTVEAALRDTLAAIDATVEIPAQRRIAARSASPTADTVLKPPAADTVLKTPRPVMLAELKRPPPLPRGVPAKPKAPAPAAKAVATCAPAPLLSEAAPPPRVIQVLGDDNTVPGLSPGSRSSSSGKVAQQSDRYRLQLEFEDTPARPLPRVSFVPPPPLPPSQRASGRRVGKAVGPRPGCSDLRDLEVIEDLGAMASALGLDSVGDITIPSLEGLPVIDDLDRHADAALSGALDDGRSAGESLSFGGLSFDGLELGAGGAFDDRSEDDDRFDDLDDDTPARLTNEMRRALVMESLDDSVERSFPSLRSAPKAPIGARPALNASKAVTPVIVKIPSRPKVSLEARERAHQLYLSAVEKLGKGDRSSAVEHLRLALDYDDGIPLYRDLLSQLEGRRAPLRRAEPPALTVLGPQGQRSQARDHWRSARPR